VFDKYAQVEARSEGTSVNRGLGLTFCRLAIEAQGGTIWIEDAPAGGACFRTVLAGAEREVPSVDRDVAVERRR
jgi:K+-sensing histidine kinase KdpD